MELWGKRRGKKCNSDTAAVSERNVAVIVLCKKSMKENSNGIVCYTQSIQC